MANWWEEGVGALKELIGLPETAVKCCTSAQMIDEPPSGRFLFPPPPLDQSKCPSPRALCFFTLWLNSQRLLAEQRVCDAIAQPAIFAWADCRETSLPHPLPFSFSLPWGSAAVL